MKIKTVYQCTSCGYQSPKWAGKCPDCGEWNTLAETAQVRGSAKAAKAAPKQPVSPLHAPVLRKRPVERLRAKPPAGCPK